MLTSTAIKIRVERFGAQNGGLPDLRLTTDDASNESHQLTWDNARVEFNLLATGNRLIELLDKSAD